MLSHSESARIQSRVNNVRLADWLFNVIRERILTWEYAPDDLLVESRLADEFEVSRTPAREALALLGQEGLVQVIPRIGYRVTSISIQDVHEIFDMRLILEGEAAACTATGTTDEELAALEAAHWEWAGALETSPGSAIEYLTYHDAFHMGIAELAGSQRLARFIGQLLREGTRLRMSDPMMANFAMVSEKEDSRSLISALKERDAAKARQLQEEHIAKSKRRTLQWLIEKGGSRSLSLV